MAVVISVCVVKDTVRKIFVDPEALPVDALAIFPQA